MGQGMVPLRFMIHNSKLKIYVYIQCQRDQIKIQSSADYFISVDRTPYINDT